MEDLISRKAAIDAILKSKEKPEFQGFMCMEQYMPEDAIEAIMSVPSVEISVCSEECHPELNDDTDEVKASVT